MTTLEEFQKDPEAALEAALVKSEATLWKYLFMWTSTLGTDGVVYGSYKHMTRKLLEGREYKIEFWDYKIGVHFTDELYDPRTYKHIPKEKHGQKVQSVEC